MARPIIAVPYVVAMIAVIVTVDALIFRNKRKQAYFEALEAVPSPRDLWTLRDSWYLSSSAPRGFEDHLECSDPLRNLAEVNSTY